MRLTLEPLNGARAVCLRKLGIFPEQEAYWELLTAMELLEESPMMLANVHKLLYPEIAGRCGGAAGSVEKNIRVCVKKCWESGTLEPLRPYLREPDNRPANSGFLSALMIWYADRLKDDED